MNKMERVEQIGTRALIHLKKSWEEMNRLIEFESISTSAIGLENKFEKLREDCVVLILKIAEEDEK